MRDRKPEREFFVIEGSRSVSRQPAFRFTSIITVAMEAHAIRLSMLGTLFILAPRGDLCRHGHAMTASPRCIAQLRRGNRRLPAAEEGRVESGLPN